MSKPATVGQVLALYLFVVFMFVILSVGTAWRETRLNERLDRIEQKIK